MTILFLTNNFTSENLLYIALLSLSQQILTTSPSSSTSSSSTSPNPLPSLLPTNISTYLKAIIFDGSDFDEEIIITIRNTYPTSFVCIYDPGMMNNPFKRLQYFDNGINMVAHDIQSLLKVLNESVLFSGDNNGVYQCPICNLDGLTERELFYHMPTYHINIPNECVPQFCPICGPLTSKPLQVHIHERHNPTRHLRTQSPKFYGFSLVVCRHPTTGHYLLCQEFCNQGYWVPGGAVDPGETFQIAAKRETMEEAGIDIDIKGILGIDYEPHFDYVRMRVVFYAEPLDLDQMPKSIPNFESAGACWCTAEEISSGLRLRGKEPKQWSRYG